MTPPTLNSGSILGTFRGGDRPAEIHSNEGISRSVLDDICISGGGPDMVVVLVEGPWDDLCLLAQGAILRDTSPKRHTVPTTVWPSWILCQRYERWLPACGSDCLSFLPRLARCRCSDLGDRRSSAFRDVMTIPAIQQSHMVRNQRARLAYHT